MGLGGAVWWFSRCCSRLRLPLFKGFFLVKVFGEKNHERGARIYEHAPSKILFEVDAGKFLKCMIPTYAKRNRRSEAEGG